MDANNTNYHLIHGERDWLPLLLGQTEVEAWWDRGRQMVSLAPLVKQLDDLSGGVLLERSRRRGAAYDHYGNIFWIDEAENAIRYHPAATPGETGIYWQVEQLDQCRQSAGQNGDFRPVSEHLSNPVAPLLRGLTVTAHEYLLVGTIDPGGLLVFDLHGGGPPYWMLWPQSIGIYPYDLCSAPDGGFWILDSNFSTGEARIWHLDSGFRIMDSSGDSVTLVSPLSNDFHNPSAVSAEVDDGCGPRRFPSGLTLNESSPALAEQPVAIEAIASNSYILLDSPPGAEASSIHYFVNDERVAVHVLDETVTGELLGQSAIVGHDFAFVPDTTGLVAGSAQRAICGDLYIAATHAQQAYKLSLTATDTGLSLILQPRLIPMRSYSGKALVASARSAYYDYQERWLPLTEQPLHSYSGEALIGGIVKDGDEPDCVWHRIIVDACIPPGTSVGFETRTANHESELVTASWQTEPELHRRSEGSELPFHQPFDDRLTRSGSAGSWDVLLQNAVGRFIEIRIRLRGNRRATPRIRSCRIYYPRFSYLNRYLPDVYRDDPESASFLDRFLANLEGLYTGLEDRIARAESLFDFRTSPAEFLEWLGDWLGAFIDPAWDEARKRLFIANAFLLFKWRGTAIGLRALLRLCIDPCPDDTIFDPLRRGGIDCDDGCSASSFKYLGNDIRIIERFLTRRHPGLVLSPAADSPEQQPGNTELVLTQADGQWSPQQGASQLHRHYQTFLALTYSENIEALNAAWMESYGDFSEIEFTPLTPENDAQKRDWQHYTRDFIGFTYPNVLPDDLPLYHEFLQRRYRQVSSLNAAHGLIGAFRLASFDDIRMPVAIPVNSQSLTDWIEFVSIALPIAQQAHTFTVLLPTVLGDLPGELERRRARVETIVEREKPAHTQFEVKFFWAMFQVGSARLGVDSHIGDSGRFVALVLGENFLGQSFLSESHPWSVVDRTVVGRERLTSSHEWRL